MKYAAILVVLFFLGCDELSSLREEKAFLSGLRAGQIYTSCQMKGHKVSESILDWADIVRTSGDAALIPDDCVKARLWAQSWGVKK